MGLSQRAARVAHPAGPLSDTSTAAPALRSLDPFTECLALERIRPSIVSVGRALQLLIANRSSTKWLRDPEPQAAASSSATPAFREIKAHQDRNG